MPRGDKLQLELTREDARLITACLRRGVAVIPPELDCDRVAELAAWLDYRITRRWPGRRQAPARGQGGGQAGSVLDSDN